MAKVLKPGDMVSIMGIPKNKYIIINPDVTLGLCKADGGGAEMPEDTVGLCHITTGEITVLCKASAKLKHCVRVSGIVEQAFPAPASTFGSPGCGLSSDEWACEREKGHPGDHMAWEVYPHVLYPNGVWKDKVSDPPDTDKSEPESEDI